MSASVKALRAEITRLRDGLQAIEAGSQIRDAFPNNASDLTDDELTRLSAVLIARAALEGDIHGAGRSMENIVWCPVDQAMPDSDLTVLAFGPSDEPVWLGWYDAESKHWMSVEAVEIKVTHWAEIPKGPTP